MPQGINQGGGAIIANASKITPHDFARSIGIQIRTNEQKAADWQAEIEKYADAIEAGLEVLVPPPCLADARRIVEGRRELRLTEVHGDPLLKHRRAA
jgi:hypothetical protein